ncbi:MAG: nucleoside-diphosphate kinase [Candidatus Thorarchaeota archaeon]
MERSLVIIKPDGTVRRKIGALVIKALRDRGFTIRAFKEMRVPQTLAEQHYAVHKDKPFFPWLVQFITSARVLVLIFEADNVIQGIRDALGATFVQKAAPDSLRGKYGIWGGINIAHASDAPETASNEISLWTKEGGVLESDTADAEVMAYIEKYASDGVDHTLEIRDAIVKAIESKSTSEDVLHTLETLLGLDARNIDDDEVKSLAEAIFALVKEEVEKKQ